ncbi:hypothetical protein JRQ81_011506 [Phrynocephalus forsythii]|uniref:Uncharacterized protein n=1 Tax=Phrynocephalus forsythii TaxID=171643 RepID=A0A9Q1AQ43_9SAUR|nr:hypothetical protein JRQ81_011506 [Phrynocephalus forsythii]
MALYGVLIERKGNRTEFGERFLLIQKEIPEPYEPNEPKGLSSRTIAGIIVACLVGSILVVALISYQTFENAQRLEPTWTVRPSFEALWQWKQRREMLAKGLEVKRGETQVLYFDSNSSCLLLRSLFPPQTSESEHTADIKSTDIKQAEHWTRVKMSFSSKTS